MRGHPRRSGRVLAAFALAATVVAGPVVAVPVEAAPAPGWIVGKVRFEPVDPTAALGVDGLGDYRGAMEVSATGGALNVINDVGLEDYVRGISEIPTSWPTEVQKAQAIAARTYALHEMGQKRSSAAFRAAGADICATEACQVYAGLAKERRPGAASWSAAVDATAGQVITYRGAPILAKYSSSNGGRSVAGGQPYLRSVDDPDDRYSPLHRWRSEVPLDALAGLFGLPGPVATATRVGDTVLLAWAAADGTVSEAHVTPLAFRARLNGTVVPSGGLPRAVPSPFFSMTSDPERGIAVLDGRGFGHAVGMSQYGALGKAHRGMKAADILAAYYAGLRPVALAPHQLPPSLRVALAVGGSATTVTSTGRFRVLDEAGRPLALLGSGSWQVLPAGGGKVRVVAPDGQDGPPAIDGLGVTPGHAAPGMPVQVTFKLSTPAFVRLSLQPPAGPPTVIDRGVLEAGAVDHSLPPVVAEGDYVLTVQADAGVNRAAAVPIGFRIGMTPPPAVQGPSSVPAAATSPVGSAPPGGLEAFALLALLAAGAGAGSAVRTRNR